ncbi:MAG: 2-phospho-L-lactate transferase [Rhodospirillaceae bacterium]|nr:2-phospho-L-lactate transferase [Rhodospirillaceae bacterium]
MLSGGVGGAKLVLGMSREISAERLLVVANTADDFKHLGFHISPDIDTLIYTLANLANNEHGWGRANESWSFMEALEVLGGETWFNLGDGDLAMHVERTRRLTAGESLTDVTAALADALGIGVKILPMTDDRVTTIVETTTGPLMFQHYFVRERCEPEVRGFRFDGIQDARPNPGFIDALRSGRIGAVIIAPSNPFVSVDPILDLPGIRAALNNMNGPVIAVSPIVKGSAIKGPAAKMMRELGIRANVSAVAQHYRGLVDIIVIDEADRDFEEQIRALGIDVLVTNTVMRTLEDRRNLARFCLGAI